jgi:hypothetical protein
LVIVDDVEVLFLGEVRQLSTGVSLIQSAMVP